MKKYRKNSIIKFCTSICIAVVLSVISCCIVYAAYINLNVAKRVVSTMSGSGTPFSSNYMLAVPKDTSTYAMKNIPCPEGANTTDIEINVCNYVQNDPSKVNENNIAYTLTFTLLNTDDTSHTGSYAGLKVTDKSNGSYSFSGGVCKVTGQTLAGKNKSVNTYTLTVPRALINSVNIRAEAEPDDSASYSAANGFKLGRIFTFSEYNASSTTWTGSFAETTTDNYDAFNYVIKGQGKGTVTLVWDPSQLEINRVFLENNSLQDKVTDSGDKKSLTMEVDSANKQNRYDIQFYKTENGVYTDMETVNGYVTVSFADAPA